LRDCDGFFKCTGKLIVTNYLDCVRLARSKDFYFDAPRNLPNFVDTRFYFVSKEFWANHVRYSYKNVNDADGLFLEHAYFKSITLVKRIPFNPVVIRYSGTSGTSGGNYQVTPREYVFLVTLRGIHGVYQRLRTQAKLLIMGK
jgi:hypothetical protein